MFRFWTYTAPVSQIRVKHVLEKVYLYFFLIYTHSDPLIQITPILKGTFSLPEHKQIMYKLFCFFSINQVN